MNVKIISVDDPQTKNVWDKLLDNSNLPRPIFSFGWFQDWLKINDSFNPYILQIDKTTIAPFVIKDHSVQFAQAYTDFNDLIGKIEGVWPTIIDFLKKTGIKKISIENIMENSATVSFFKDYMKRNEGEIIADKSAPYLNLLNNFEEYLVLPELKSKRRKYRKFQNDFPDVKFLISSDPTKDIEILLEITKEDSYKSASMTKEKADFFRLAATDSENILMPILKLHNEIIAVLFNFLDSKTCYLYISAYNKDKYPNIGTFAIFENIKWAIENQFTQYSFLKGQGQYKYEFGAKDLPLYTVNINLS